MKIFISAGDPSGDLHGSNLIKQLKLQNPGVSVSGFGGSKMSAVSDILDKVADSSIIGFWEPVRNIVRLKRDFNTAKKIFREQKPDILILIDYYGFNIHLAKEAKKHDIPVVYFISPQVWATRESRIKELKKYVKKMLVIFPFEEEIYNKAGIDCEFVGHPLLDVIPSSLVSRPSSLGSLTIGLMPGSRIQELNRHVIPFLKAVKQISDNFGNVNCVITVSSDNIKEYIKQNFNDDIHNIKFISHGDYEQRAGMDVCITSSGTATVENLILGIPMVIVYKTSFFTYFIAKSLIKVKNIGMVNILAGETICPELIQNDATPKKISEMCIDLIRNEQNLNTMRQKILKTREKLGGPGAVEKTAKIILNSIS
ncbi:MAG: lipid-A-disaccharide synthase [Elusimicrobia bacterium]|nr:lipid-A-disaccharide synthase [Elusimicrobiota bacterium]